MGLRGPTGKKTAELLESGDYRPHEHDVRKRRPDAGGAAVPPEGLAEPGKALWFQIVDHLESNGLCGEIDSAALAHCCEVYNLMKATLQTLSDDPTNKDARCSYTAYANEWGKYVAKFGMTPLDRLRIVVGHDKGTTDEDRDLLGD